MNTRASVKSGARVSELQLFYMSNCLWAFEWWIGSAHSVSNWPVQSLIVRCRGPYSSKRRSRVVSDQHRHLVAAKNTTTCFIQPKLAYVRIIRMTIDGNRIQCRTKHSPDPLTHINKSCENIITCFAYAYTYGTVAASCDRNKTSTIGAQTLQLLLF